MPNLLMVEFMSAILGTPFNVRVVNSETIELSHTDYPGTYVYVNMSTEFTYQLSTNLFRAVGENKYTALFVTHLIMNTHRLEITGGMDDIFEMPDYWIIRQTYNFIPDDAMSMRTNLMISNIIALFQRSYKISELECGVMQSSTAAPVWRYMERKKLAATNGALCITAIRGEYAAIASMAIDSACIIGSPEGYMLPIITFRYDRDLTLAVGGNTILGKCLAQIRRALPYHSELAQFRLDRLGPDNGLSELIPTIDGTEGGYVLSLEIPHIEELHIGLHDFILKLIITTSLSEPYTPTDVIDSCILTDGVVRHQNSADCFKSVYTPTEVRS